MESSENYFVHLAFTFLFFTIIFCQNKANNVRMHNLPSILLGFIIVLFSICNATSFYYFTGTMSSWKSWVQLLLMSLNIFCNIMSWRMLIRFGPGDFSRVNLTGKYAVGHRYMHSAKLGNNVGVFYPVDKSHEKELVRKMGPKAYKVHFDQNDPEEMFNQTIEVILWMVGEKIPSTKYFQYMKDSRNKALLMADLAANFANGGEQLIPVIFSHGLGASWRQHQMVGMEMASHGYLVFFLDHLDGSCIYSEL